MKVVDVPLLAMEKGLKQLISNAYRTVSLSDPHIVEAVDEQQPGQDPLDLLILDEERAEREGNISF